MTLPTLLRSLFGASPALDPAALASLRAFRDAHRARAAALASPFERAVLGGASADRLGYAFAAGYEAALEALLAASGIAPAPSARAEALVLCATEEGGAHPRAIRTALARDEAGALRLTGKKRWATLATETDALLVVASIGEDEAGRNRLKVARVPADAPGVRITPMPEPPFAPEIPHAELALEGVQVREDDVLPGDGYEEYLKPFRTIEDAHVHGAALGYLVGVGRRHGWPEATLERLAALIAGAQAIAATPPAAPEAHLALAGLLGASEALIREAAPLWERAEAGERARWARDLPLLTIAGRAREARRAKAWERLRGSAPRSDQPSRT